MSMPDCCQKDKCCYCLPGKLGMSLIGIIGVIDVPLLWWFVYMIYDRSGLIYAIAFAIFTLP